MFERIDFTYEAGTDEPVHPDMTICWRFVEVGMSGCEYGCKIYADPKSNVRVLKHYKGYGCNVMSSQLKYEDDVIKVEFRIDELV